jgi:hypothetical protein
MDAFLHAFPKLSHDMRVKCRQEPVYRGDMVHRNPGDASTLSPMEHPFSVTHSWVASEAGAGAGTGEGEAGGDGAVGGEANDGLGRSFTRVLIGDLKPDIMELIMGEEAGRRICQQLAHLYHFYLHGAAGNRHADGAGAARGTLPNGEALPEIVVRYMQDAHMVWGRSLAEVSGGCGCWGANGYCQGGGRKRCCGGADRDCNGYFECIVYITMQSNHNYGKKSIICCCDAGGGRPADQDTQDAEIRVSLLSGRP